MNELYNYQIMKIMLAMNPYSLILWMTVCTHVRDWLII